MTSYIISYDLIKRKDYQTLWDELDRLKAHRALESVWLLNVNNTAKQILDHFQTFIDADDRFFVAELTNNHATTRAKAGTTNWISNNPPSR